MKSEFTRNPLSLFKPATLLRMFVATAALTARGTQARDVMGASHAPAIAPAPGTSALLSGFYAPNVDCHLSGDRQAEIERLQYLCNDPNFPGMLSGNDVLDQLGVGQDYKPYVRGLQPNPTARQVCAAGAEQGAQLLAHCGSPGGGRPVASTSAAMGSCSSAAVVMATIVGAAFYLVWT